MPCPFFEPREVTPEPADARARLPLLEEYDGICRAAPVAQPVPAANRFRCCNHGYTRGNCQHFPFLETRSAYRFHVADSGDQFLKILWIEERQYAPVRWEPVSYSLETGALTPMPADPCLSAQIVAFCRSYRRLFPS